MYTYVVYGLTLESEIELPELIGTEALPSCDPIPVEIRKGNVPHDLPNATTTVEGYQILKDKALFVATGTARFLVRQGKIIEFTQEEGHEPSWLRIVLLSGALGILLHQRGLFPLHASAVVSNEACIAFGGQSGVGKSTLAAGLSRQGLKLMAEDKLIVRHTGNGWIAWPGIPFLHLFANSAQHAGLSVKTQASTSPRAGKYIHFDRLRFEYVPRVLKALYLMEWVPENSKSAIAAISPSDAFFKLRAHASLNGLITAMGREALFLQWAADFLKDIPVVRFSRPKNYAEFEWGLELLRNHWISLI